MKKITSYEEFCKAFRDGNEARENAILLLYIQNWIISVIKNTDEDYFDASLDELYINSIKQKVYSAKKKDALYYINSRVEDACNHIFLNMREKIVRENELLPVHKAKEINSYGIGWLSRKPGRTIREKMSGNNSIMAVNRRMSLDTGENRLLIAFVKRVHELLQVKIDNVPKEYIDESEYEFYQLMSSFLRNPELSEVKRWENLPPNNTLLSDNYYKKVWKAWNEIKDLDDLVSKGSEVKDRRLMTCIYVELLLEIKSNFSFPQVPMEIQYSEYGITLLTKIFYGIDTEDNKITVEKPEDRILVEYCQTKYEIVIRGGRLIIIKDNVQISDISINAGNIRKCVSFIVTKIGCTTQKGNEGSNSSVLKKYKNVVIDLFSVHPEYIADDGTIEKLESRLLQQKHTIPDEVKEEKNYYVSCEYSDAILMPNTNVQTYTIASAIDCNSKEQMKRLIMTIKRKIVAENLIFVFPDIFNEFQLSMVHKAVRLAYRKVRAFPKSIGVVFRYQESEEFRTKFKENDFVLVVDLVDDEITFTLVKGVCDEHQFNELEDYGGIIWERHPTFSLSCDEYVKSVQEILIKCGCQTPELMYKVFGTKGIGEEYEKLVCMFDDHHYFRIDERSVKAVNDVVINITDMVSKFLQTRRDIIGKSKIHIISLSDSFVYKGLGNYQVYGNDDSLVGFARYNELQKYESKPLWRDHLPDLAIKLLYGKFDLVNQATVLPNFNAVQEIKIENTFTLVKNKKQYRFQLVQNDMNSKMQYEAVIKQAAFPLKQEVECKLRMTYRYGAEEPYELLFVPIDKKQAGFIEAKVEWKQITDYEYEDLEYPEFPDMKTWDELQNYPALDGVNYNNLTIWLSTNFNVISQGYYTINIEDYGLDLNSVRGEETVTIDKIIDDEDTKIVFKESNFENAKEVRQYAKIVSFDVKEAKKKENPKRYTTNLFDGYRSSWFNKGTGYYCIRNVCIDGVNQSVAFYESNFADPSEFNPSISYVSFELKCGRNQKYKAENIRPGDYVEEIDNTKKYDAIYVRKGNKPRATIADNGRLFAMHTVFFGGRSIYENGCPELLRTSFEECVPMWLDMYNVCEDMTLKSKMFTMMSLVAKDIGSEYFDIAHNIIDEYLEDRGKLSDSIGYALGNLRTEEQNNLFNKIVKIRADKVVCILSKAVWKNKDFVFNIPTPTLVYYFEFAIDEMTNLCNKYEVRTTQMRGYNVTDISMYVEYLLAVFRLRELNDEEICKKISMNNPKVKSLYFSIERLIEMEIPIKSRLQLEVHKKGDFENRNIPDLLFVLLVYITGNTGESDIKISGVNGDD